MRKWIFPLLLLLVAVDPLSAQMWNIPAGRVVISDFAGLGTPNNGTLRYCSDCTAGSPCAGAGTGAWAYRTNGAWECTVGSGTGGVPTTITVAASSDATSSIAFFESATGDLGPKTDPGITYDATTNILTTTGGYAGILAANLPAASTTAVGGIEIATGAETTTGTDATRAVSPDGLAGSDYGKRVATVQLSADADAITTGDGKAYYIVPSLLNGWNLVGVEAGLTTVSSSGNPTWVIRNVTDAVDMTSTGVSIDASEFHSSTAATAVVINGATDDVATGDRLAFDCDVAGTGAKGPQITLIFQLP